MNRHELLGVMDFGDGVAEQEQQLSRYFIETQAFNEFVAGRYDLVLGHKGSGKTAIFRMVVDQNYTIPALAATDVIPAVDLYDNIRFRRLGVGSQDPTPGEVYASWRTYIAALVANHLVDTYDSDVTREIRESLEVTGLREQSTSPPRQNIFSRFFNPAPLSLKSSRGEVSIDVDPQSITTILDESMAVLRQLGRKCWIIFDRLDEAFSDSTRLEAVALRELLQIVRDFNYPNSELRVKAFLRNDIFARISFSRQRLVNMTHIAKTQISWPRDILIDLICRRLAECQHFLTEFGFSADHLRRGGSRSDMIKSLLPAALPSNYPHWPDADPMEWIMTGTAFGGAQYSPRNVLSFLELARRHQMEWQRLNPSIVGPSLLSPTTLRFAATAVSELRRDDTLLVEFPEVFEHLSKIRGGPAEYETRQALAYRLGLGDEKDARFKSVLDLLLNSGTLESLPNERLGVALLYRPALEVQG